MRLQSLDTETGLMINEHPFGCELHQFIWSDEALSLLNNRCGWLDGGCLLLASALHNWSLGQLRPVTWMIPSADEGGDIVSHYAMALDLGEGELAILDGNGVGTLADFEAIMREEHRLPHGYMPYVELDASIYFNQALRFQRDPLEANLAPSDTRPLRLTQMLTRQFGIFDRDRIELSWPYPEDESMQSAPKATL